MKMKNVLFKVIHAYKSRRFYWFFNRIDSFAPLPCPVMLFGSEGFCTGFMFLCFEFGFSVEKIY